VIKYNTVLFKNDTGTLYIGVKENSKIVSFNRLKLSPTQEMQIRSTLVGLQLNEFLLVEVEVADDKFKLTPFTCGTVSETDGLETTNLHEIDHDKLLQLFNDLIPENLLQD
jgi:hypothetical protein